MGPPTLDQPLWALHAGHLLAGAARARPRQGADQGPERRCTLAVWGQTRWFTEGGQAALALTEAGTCLGDQGESMPEEIFEEAAGHVEQPVLDGSVAAIASIAAWSCPTVASRQVSGAQRAQVVASAR